MALSFRSSKKVVVSVGQPFEMATWVELIDHDERRMWVRKEFKR